MVCGTSYSKNAKAPSVDSAGLMQGKSHSDSHRVSFALTVAAYPLMPDTCPLRHP